MYYTESFKQDTFVPARFESQGSITLRGQEVKYHTVSEDNVFFDAQGKPIASIFSYSYFRDGVEDLASRPVIFCFNGGPGSASMYVHAGMLAPKRVAYTEPLDREHTTAPYPMIDNPQCMLDEMDIVVVEPVGVGYGVLIDETKADQFWGIEEDAEALLRFIESWMQRYNRIGSPKYLMGESYGCIRCATAVGIASNGGKEKNYGVRFDGVILIGNTVVPSPYYGETLPVPLSVLRFPTYAAINWYHNHPSDQTVEEFVMEAKAFADYDYLLALYKGDDLQGEERKQMKEKIHYYTNVSDQYLETNNLEIDENTFRAEILKDKGLAVGRCDGRFTRPLSGHLLAEADPKHALWDDAFMDRYEAYFYAGMTGTIGKMLNINLNRTYTPTFDMSKYWNQKCEGGNTAERLRDAMWMTFGMRTFFANGWYDACTEIGFAYYTLNHAGLPKDRCYIKGYPSGHMLYVSDENIEALTNDIRKFVKKQDPTE